LYSKAGGKDGKHADKTESSNITAVSYLAVQVFQHNVARQFSVFTMMPFQTKQFLHLPPHQFLCLVESTVRITPGSSFVEISLEDLTRFFCALEAGQKQLEVALKAFGKRKPKGAADAED
jgi:uncharacterized membrane protein